MTFFLWGVWIVISWYILRMFLLFFLQQRIIFEPSCECSLSGDDSFKEVKFFAEDGVMLSGLWLERGSDITILFLPGKKGNIYAYPKRLSLLREVNANVLLVDYRGYGGSGGIIKKENDLYTDGRAALDYIKKVKGISRERVVVWGLSLGGATAIEIARRYPVEALVLEGCFFSLREIAQQQHPFFPIKWLLKYPFESGKKLAQVIAPVLIIHSREDRVVPFEQAQKLFETAREPKKLVPILGKHTLLESVEYETILQSVRAFLYQR